MLSRFTRGKLLVAAVVVLLLALPLTVLADSPHFINASGSIQSDLSLKVNFKEAGLGTNQQIDYVLTADATAVYYCINGGNNHPKAANKETVSGPLSTPGTFNSGKNGQVTASLSVGPIGPGSFSCPNGQRLELGEIHYSNVVLRDTTNGVSIDVSGGPFDYVKFTF